MRFVLMTLPDGTAIESVVRDPASTDHLYALTRDGVTLEEFTTIAEVSDYLRRTRGDVDELLIYARAQAAAEYQDAS